MEGAHQSMHAETPMTSQTTVFAGSEVSDLSHAGSGRSRDVTGAGEILNNVDCGSRASEAMRKHANRHCALKYCGRGRFAGASASLTFVVLAGIVGLKVKSLRRTMDRRINNGIPNRLLGQRQSTATASCQSLYQAINLKPPLLCSCIHWYPDSHPSVWHLQWTL